jgi:hypothetical protein
MGWDNGAEVASKSQSMSALGQKQTSDWRPLMSALPPKADIGTGTRVSPSTQQLRQLGDVRRDPPRLVAGRHFRPLASRQHRSWETLNQFFDTSNVDS